VGSRFSAPVQTGPGAHPVSNTLGTTSFPGVKGLERVADHPTHLAPRLKKSRAVLLLPSGSSWPIIGRLYIYFTRYTLPYALSYTGCPTTYQTRQFFNNFTTNEDIATITRRTTDTFLFISHLRTYFCSNLVAISSLVLELLKNCQVLWVVEHPVHNCQHNSSYSLL
jgi:hypothetical protein